MWERASRGILRVMGRPAVNVAALSREEQLQLLDELWEALGREPDALPLTDEQRRDWTSALMPSSEKARSG